MEQAWNSFFWSIRQLMDQAASPFVVLASRLGLELTAGQVWMTICTLPFILYAAYFLYVELMLSRRGVKAVGTVIDIDPGDETADRPVIAFRDQRGNPVVFTSHLGVNAMTGTVGAKVDIRFDPVEPRRAREIGRSGAKAVYLVFLAVFIACMIFGTVMARYAIY